MKGKKIIGQTFCGYNANVINVRFYLLFINTVPRIFQFYVALLVRSNLVHQLTESVNDFCSSIYYLMAFTFTVSIIFQTNDRRFLRPIGVSFIEQTIGPIGFAM